MRQTRPGRSNQLRKRGWRKEIRERTGKEKGGNSKGVPHTIEMELRFVTGPIHRARSARPRNVSSAMSAGFASVKSTQCTVGASS